MLINIKTFKAHLVLFVLLIIISLIYLIPNFFKDELYISVETTKNENIEYIYKKLKKNLSTYKLDTNIHIKKKKIKIYAPTIKQQEKIKKITESILKHNKKCKILKKKKLKTPKFFKKIQAKALKLGLDLKGGVHFLIKVDTTQNNSQENTIFITKLQETFYKKKINYIKMKNKNDKITIKFNTEKNTEKIYLYLLKKYKNIKIVKNNKHLYIKNKDNISNTNQNTVILQQTIDILKNRIEALGITETIVQQQGTNKIIIEMPGVFDIIAAKRILGKIATLEFYIVDENNNSTKINNVKTVLDKNNNKINLKKEILLRGESITNATNYIDQQTNKPVINIFIDKKKTIDFKNNTKKNIGKLMGIVYKEIKEVSNNNLKKKILHEKIINIARIATPLGETFQITGLNIEETKELTILLKTGSLPANITIVEEYLIGPSVGENNIYAGITSIILGVLAIFSFMFLYYNLFGFFANIVLFINLLMLLATISFFNITLTLYGIAGILLTLGMAIDANVLIFERIKEELKLKKTIQESINDGFKMAYATILDSNITTFLIGFVLYLFGHGVLKCFATTLCLGILTSLYTTLFGTWLLILLYLKKNTKINKLPIGISL